MKILSRYKNFESNCGYLVNSMENFYSIVDEDFLKLQNKFYPNLFGGIVVSFYNEFPGLKLTPLSEFLGESEDINL